MPYEYAIVREVEFADTDMAGIMHFSNFFRYMEAAEHGFFRSLGFSIHRSGPDPLGWPRVCRLRLQVSAPVRGFRGDPAPRAREAGRGASRILSCFEN